MLFYRDATVYAGIMRCIAWKDFFYTCGLVSKLTSIDVFPEPSDPVTVRKKGV